MFSNRERGSHMCTWPFLTISIGNHIYENLTFLKQESMDEGKWFHLISDTAEIMSCYRVSLSCGKELVSMTFSSSVSATTNHLILQLGLR